MIVFSVSRSISLPAKPESSFNKIISPGKQLPRMQLPSSIFNFSARHRDAQSHGDIVGDVVAADGKATALFHCAIGVQDVIGRPAAHIDDQRAKILLMLSERHLRRSEPAKNNV